MLTDFIGEKSRTPEEQWVVMGNSIGGLLTLMLTEGLQEGRKVMAHVLTYGEARALAPRMTKEVISPLDCSRAAGRVFST